jgi:hypothetical protein
VSQLPAAAFLLSTLWEPGQTITIDFIDAYAAEWKKAWVKKVVTELVQPYVNLNLAFGNYGYDADIRITFEYENQAYSRLGTQSAWYKGADAESPESMNLGWLDEPQSGSFVWEGVTYTVPACSMCSSNQNGSVIIHEFGHALGMVHEHQNPSGGIDWNVDAVLAYFSKYPNNWTTDQIEFNVLDKYSADVLNASQFDPQSVMLYAFPSELTNDGTSTEANAIMSATDIEWMENVYGTPASGDAPVVDESPSTSSTTTTTTTTTTPPTTVVVGGAEVSKGGMIAIGVMGCVSFVVLIGVLIVLGGKEGVRS